MHFRQFALGSTAFVALALAALMPAAAQTRDPAIKIGDSDLGGVVTGPNGPEAGVWVIAETTDLPTKFAKMVVTDDKGGRMFVCSDTDYCEKRQAAQSRKAAE